MKIESHEVEKQEVKKVVEKTVRFKREDLTELIRRKMLEEGVEALPIKISYRCTGKYEYDDWGMNKTLVVSFEEAVVTWEEEGEE